MTKKDKVGPIWVCPWEIGSTRHFKKVALLWLPQVPSRASLTGIPACLQPYHFKDYKWRLCINNVNITFLSVLEPADSGSIRITSSWLTIMVITEWDNEILDFLSGMLIRTPLINAQCWSTPIKIVLLMPMPIKKDQCRSNCLNFLSLLRGILDQFQNFDRHWALIGGVLVFVWESAVFPSYNLSEH